VRAALESGDAHNKRSNAMAEKLGMTVCSQ
jgi:hypothetical protein